MKSLSSAANACSPCRPKSFANTRVSPILAVNCPFTLAYTVVFSTNLLAQENGFPTGFEPLADEAICERFFEKMCFARDPMVKDI